MAQYYEEGFDPEDINIKVSELLVATADASDELIDKAVTEVLALLRERLKMDVVFVSEFIGGERVFRYVDTPNDRPVIGAGMSSPLEESWCQRVVDGRLPELIPKVSDLPSDTDLPPAPFEIGTHISAPILLKDGQVYGTICTFSFSPHNTVNQRDLKNLKSVAMLVAQKIEMSRARPGKRDEPVRFAQQP